MIKEIVITSIEKTTKDGRKFLVHKAKMLSGGDIQFKFRREIKKIPEKAGKYLMTIDSAFLQKSSTDYGDVYWVKGEPESIKDYVTADTAAEDF